MTGKITNKCLNCVNLLQIKNKFECDYGYFKQVNSQTIKLYIPILFNCIKFEDIRKLK